MITIKRSSPVGTISGEYIDRFYYSVDISFEKPSYVDGSTVRSFWMYWNNYQEWLDGEIDDEKLSKLWRNYSDPSLWKEHHYPTSYTLNASKGSPQTFTFSQDDPSERGDYAIRVEIVKGDVLAYSVFRMRYGSFSDGRKYPESVFTISPWARYSGDTAYPRWWMYITDIDNEGEYQITVRLDLKTYANNRTVSKWVNVFSNTYLMRPDIYYSFSGESFVVPVLEDTVSECRLRAFMGNRVIGSKTGMCDIRPKRTPGVKVEFLDVTPTVLTRLKDIVSVSPHIELVGVSGTFDVGISIGNEELSLWYDVGYYRDDYGDYIVFKGISDKIYSFTRKFLTPGDTSVRDVWVRVLNHDTKEVLFDGIFRNVMSVV